ncbi:hypothetical protein [Levilactobacillus suantsaiihabitans]|uniref:Uncharacterized protein n=1 Tax=Levilactobacillus suantsaiihabitans TaxID=2487722 RepID=A0A4Z0J6Y5_9LACO|nr:hypothetical protein [Levilactobacillus suantsaiihabitans]TGD17538.1 hypothetical protein EGT51_12035 [Levilactobacillus suantsaiihabitans]
MNKTVRLATVALTAMTLGSVVVPSVSAFADTIGTSAITKVDYQNMDTDKLGNIVSTYDMDNLTTDWENVINIYTAKLQVELKSEVLASAPAITTPQRPQSRAAAGLMAYLIARYGKVYVAKTLPKIVYKKFAKVIGKKVSEKKFVKVWGNAMDVATGAALEKVISKGLHTCGLSKGVSNTIAAGVVTVVEVLV